MKDADGKVLNIGFVGEAEHVNREVIDALGSAAIYSGDCGGVGADTRVTNINADLVAGSGRGAISRKTDVADQCVGSARQSGQGVDRVNHCAGGST